MDASVKLKLRRLGKQFRQKAAEIAALSRLVAAYCCRKYGVHIAENHAILIASHAMRMHDETYIPKVECMVVYAVDAIKFFGYRQDS